MPFRAAQTSRLHPSRVRLSRVARRPPSRPIDSDDEVGLDGVRVLVIDDEWDNRQLLTAILVRAGAVVKTAGSVAAAIASMPGFKPDLVVSDIGMPDEDGYSLMRRVRALAPDAGGATPAIAITGFSGSDVRRQALEAGFTAYLSKPIHPREFLRAAHRLVQSGPSEPT